MRADARTNRQDLLTAAWEQFADHGASVSLRSVAQRAGVGIGTLYRHFATRTELIIGLVDEIASRVGSIVADQGTDWDDAERRWPEFVHRVAALQIGALAYQLGPTINRSSDIFATAIRTREAMFAGVDGILTRAKTAGLVDPAVGVAAFFVGLSSLTRPVPAPVREGLPGLTDWLIDTYISGLRSGRHRPPVLRVIPAP